MAEPPTVVVALSAPLLREGVALLLRDATAEVLDVPATRDLPRAHGVDAVVVTFDGTDEGCRLLAQLRSAAPDVRIVAVHDGEPPRHLRRARASGASVLVDITTEAATLVAAVRGEHDRTLRRWAPPRVGRVPLDEREREVLTLIARGASTRDVAQILSLKTHAVERRMQDLLRKLGATNQAQAVAVAVRDGLLEPTAGDGAAP